MPPEQPVPMSLYDHKKYAEEQLRASCISYALTAEIPNMVHRNKHNATEVDVVKAVLVFAREVEDYIVNG